MTDSFRKTALKLHGLARRDRRWLLKQLAPEQRQRVGEYLQQLATMGIPSESDLVERAGETTVIASPADAEKDRLADSDIVDALPAETVLERLEGEPDWIVAAVLAAREWQWTREFLEGLASARRKKLCQLAQDLAPFERMQSVLVKELAGSVIVTETEPEQSRFDHLLRDIEHTLHHGPMQ